LLARISGKKEWKLAFNNYSQSYSPDHIIAAFTAPDLGEMLPIEIDAKVEHQGISSELLGIQKSHFGGKDEISWQVMYYEVNFEKARTEADARAKMPI